jgi:uracil-DNA glycosylase
MNSDDIKSMFAGISEQTKEIIARKLRAELAVAITSINAKMTATGKTCDHLSPSPELIMNAFRLCSLEQARIVIIGQDPYIQPGQAQGLSFSVPVGKTIPPSLKAIYKCLNHHGLINEIPAHGDLSNWACQGVLLLNCALTTFLGKSNEHAAEWSKYTDALLREISNLPRQVIFILLGGFAQEKAALIDARKHIILEWGHPSPLNSANRTDNPKNFKYCDAFVRANNTLILRGESPINWDPNATESPPIPTVAQIRAFKETMPKPTQVAQRQGYKLQREPVYILRECTATDPAPLTINTLWLFTDGGSRGNGKEDCSASWGFYITDGCTCVEARGIVEEMEIPGQVYKSSNNRGELSALLKGLEYISRNIDKFSFDDVRVVSDSEYSINCLNKWIVSWLANPTKHKLAEKKNLDLIIAAKEALDYIRGVTRLEFQHVNSHLREPKDSDTTEWFIWKCNDLVDKLCGLALGR